MASRKVLINYHTSGSSAPAAANVYHGELVVAHETGKETIFTKNNANNMVPFVSCAQTISIIDGKISAAQVDVVKKTGEEHLEIATSPTQPKVFTLNTKDVASETNLNALSAGTVSKLTSLTNVVSALTDVVVTGISGDSIIVATKVENGTGSNTYNLTHKGQTAVASGFNKLATDAYGHVTASTAVAASDIEGLGFKSSAWTEEKITAAIEALDSSSAVTAGKYMTGIAIKDGKISGITQADLPKLASATTGDGNVVTDIAVNDHTITFKKDLTVASDQDLKNLSAVTITGVTAAGVAVPVANHVAKIYSASSSNFGVVKIPAQSTSFITNSNGSIKVATGTSSSQVARGDHFAAVSAATTANTQNLNNLSAVTITGVSMNGSNVTVTDHVAVLGDVVTAETQLEKTVSGNGNVFTDIDVDDHAIVINKGITALTGVSTPNSDKYLSVSVSSNSAITVGEKKAVVADKTALGNVTATGSLVDAKAVKDYVDENISSSVDYKGATATLPTSSTVGDMYITTASIAIPAGSSATGAAQTAETGDFIIARSSGKWDVIQKNLDGAVTGNLTADTLTLGDGPHTVKSLANGTEGQVLVMGESSPEWVNGLLTDSATTEAGHYNPTTTASTLGDAASGKFIKTIKVDSKKHAIEVTTGTAIVTETQVTTADGTTGDSAAAAITGITASNHKLTLNKSNKIFSASTADEAVKTKSALTFTFADGSADVVFDGSANKTVNIPENTDTATTEEGHYTPTTSASTKGTTAATTTSFVKGIRIDRKNHVIDVVTGAVITAETDISLTNNTPGDTASAVVSGIATGGTKGHTVTVSKTNKVFSATTADSAVTATSAKTSVSATTSVSAVTSTSAKTSESAVTAASAAKVAKALTMTDGTATQTYDGSAARTLTFGTTTTAGKSMSMTSAGVVDVEIIDCGTY